MTRSARQATFVVRRRFSDRFGLYFLITSPFQQSHSSSRMNRAGNAIIHSLLPVVLGSAHSFGKKSNMFSAELFRSDRYGGSRIAGAVRGKFYGTKTWGKSVLFPQR